MVPPPPRAPRSSRRTSPLAEDEPPHAHGAAMRETSDVSPVQLRRRFRAAFSETDPPQSKLVMVDFRSGESILTHPGIMPHVEEGWHVQSAEPRVTEEGTQLLVVLARL